MYFGKATDILWKKNLYKISSKLLPSVFWNGVWKEGNSEQGKSTINLATLAPTSPPKHNTHFKRWNAIMIALELLAITDLNFFQWLVSSYLFKASYCKHCLWWITGVKWLTPLFLICMSHMWSTRVLHASSWPQWAAACSGVQPS